MITQSAMDTTRFYPNMVRSQEELSSKYTRWTKQRFKTVAQQLLERCVKSYEPALQAQGSLGSLYTGALGPLVYLRFHLAKSLKKTDTDTTAANQLLNDALQIAQAATTWRMQFAQNHTSESHFWKVASSARKLCSLLFYIKWIEKKRP
jgi:hypothetical protein